MMTPELTAEVRAGLRASPLRLPAALLYDALGSTLFEAITLLPEYRLSRVDLDLLTRHADVWVAALGGDVELVELGPGAGRKAKVLAEALLRRQGAGRFVAIDVSAEALRGCRKTLEALTGLTVETVEATWLDGLARARRTGVPRLVAFLGSNLSNFDRHDAAAFFADVRRALQPGDGFLVAVDLDKAPEELLPAYDDALGVTASFNRNVLVRLAREAGSTLPVDAFAHRARWNAAERRIEMHLEALRPVRGEVLGVGVALEPGQTLWTESSHRFTVDELRAWGSAAGFELVRAEVAEPWAFAQVLFTLPRGATT